MHNEISRLNDAHGADGRILFVSGPGGLPLLRIRNEAATAEISLYGGQVLDYRHPGEPDNRLFLSEKAYFQAGRAIKGGVPLCWPWFGADPDNAGRGAHGFARTSHWRVGAVEETDPARTRVTLLLEDDARSLAAWPFRFRLSLTIVVGPRLALELATENRDSRPFRLTQALHTYFAVNDIRHVRVDGLDGLDYLDKVLDFARLRQGGPVLFDQEVDRVYLGVTAPLTVSEPGRRIRITPHGSRTAVVWNPWDEIAREMADLDDGDYRRFVCVETANAADEVITLAPGGSSVLGAEYDWLQEH